MQYLVTSFYKFFPIPTEQLQALKTHILVRGQELNLFGLFLLGAEGINATLSGAPDSLGLFKTELVSLLQCEKLTFKDTQSDKPGYPELCVKIRPEIVTLDRPNLVPQSSVDNHLSPEEFHRIASSGQATILDTRNTYETQIGKFKSAVELDLEIFREFPDKLADSKLPKDDTYLIYCTGGIRCEKAILEMRNQGYNQVFQLDGGIINYLKSHPNELFEGECFVFDYRVAIDQNLGPTSKYLLCPHCGQPADIPTECPQCGKTVKICSQCLSLAASRATCSKNCAHHFSRTQTS